MDELIKILSFLARKKIFLVLVAVISTITYFILFNIDDKNYSATVSFDRNVLPSQHMLFCGFSETCVDEKLYTELKQNFLENNPIGFKSLALDLRRHYAVFDFDRQPTDQEINEYLASVNQNFKHKVLLEESALSDNIDKTANSSDKYYSNNFIPSLKINALTTIDILSSGSKEVFNFHVMSIRDTRTNSIVLIFVSLSFGIFLSTAFLVVQYEISRRHITTSG